jgi:MFS family permease
VFKIAGSTPGKFNLITLITALEYFDFISFSLFFSYIPFAHSHPWLQFVVGFLGRFIGSIAVSLTGRKLGSQKILILSVWCMTICTFLIGILPNHSFCRYLLYVLRALQGLSFAIEFPIGSLLAAKKNEYGSTVQGSTLGCIFAASLFEILTGLFAGHAVWRIPFLIGGVVGLYVAIQRTRDFDKALDRDQLVLRFLSYLSIIWIFLKLEQILKLDWKIYIIGLLAFWVLVSVRKRIFTSLQSFFGDYPNPSRLVAPIIYFLSLFLALTYSIAQTKVVSTNSTLAGLSLISFVIPLVFARVPPIIFQSTSSFLLIASTLHRSLSFLNLDIKLTVLISAVTIGVLNRLPFGGVLRGLLYLDFIRYQPILFSNVGTLYFILNQTVVTSFMLTCIQVAGSIFKSHHLAPVMYNGIALLASMALNYLSR